jgi:hypothetical protein
MISIIVALNTNVLCRQANLRDERQAILFSVPAVLEEDRKVLKTGRYKYVRNLTNILDKKRGDEKEKHEKRISNPT